MLYYYYYYYYISASVAARSSSQLAQQQIPNVRAILQVAREFRSNLIQTADQYAFVFQAAIAKIKSSEWTHVDQDDPDASGSPAAAEELSRV